MPKPFICRKCGFDLEFAPRHDCEPLIKTPSQQSKTVADAYEWANGEWQGFYTTIWYSEGNGELRWGGAVTEDTVCTREQFEAYAKEQEGEQEGEKWTHVTSLGKCRVLIHTPDEHGYLVVEMEDDGYSLVPPRGLKPLKPRITKAQAWDKLANTDILSNLGDEFVKLSKEYEVIDE